MLQSRQAPQLPLQKASLQNQMPLNQLQEDSYYLFPFLPILIYFPIINSSLFFVFGGMRFESVIIVFARASLQWQSRPFGIFNIASLITRFAVSTFCFIIWITASTVTSSSDTCQQS